jgi:hypothetical protein
MSTVLSEATGAALAPETTIAVLPTAGWAIVQPNPGGIQGIEPKLKTVERDPLSVFATPEKGDNVGLDAEVTIVHDWNKDIADTLGESMFRCAASHFGGTGVSLFRPTAVTATGYTVPAAGALANGVLVYARGFSTAANNGLKKLAGASISTEIKTPGLTAEAAPPANATVDVIGYEASVAADIQVDASGNLTSTVLNFTTLNIPIGSWVILPTATQALAMGSAAYAFALYSGRARVTAITATKLTLERQTWTVGGADTAAGKTVRLFFASRFYRNYTLDTLGSIPGYKKATLHGEIAEQGPGTANAATYVELQGMAVDTAELNAPLEDKIVLTTKFRGLNIQDPVLLASRPGGAGSVAGDSPAKAYAPQATSLVDTANDLKLIRLTDSTGTRVGEINSWKWTVNHEAKARKVQATFGAIDHTYGKFMFSVSMEAYYNDFNVIKALRDNRALAWDAFAQNDQFGFQLDLPNVALRNGPRTFAANEPVMITCDIPAFRNTADNIAGSLCVFGYLP